jgi:hypothetical protein
MRILSLLLFVTLGLTSQVLGQVDIANARANPKTFIFDDDKHTVHGYIYNTLKEKSSCCGNDAIYLEVKFDQSGIVTSAKTLTGKNDCYKKSVVDIVQNVRWDATGVTGSKTIYFEVKPIIPCSGSPGENVYKQIALDGGIASNITPIKTKEGSQESGNGGVKGDEKEVVKEVAIEEKEPVKEVVKETVAKVDEKVTKEDEFLSEDEAVKEIVKAEPVVKKEPVVVKSEPVVKKEPVVKAEPVVAKTEPATTAKVKPSGPIKIPPQEKLEYVSKGDVRPEESHNKTFVNIAPPTQNKVEYADENTISVELRTALRKAGFCGLAHAAVELETDPRSGNVINVRVMQANDPKVSEVVPGIVKGLRFKSLSGAANRYVYTEFKCEIVCEGQKSKVDLENVEEFLVHPSDGRP